MICCPSRNSAALICSKFVFVSSKTIVAVWLTGFGSTVFTPSILDTVILTVVAVSPQTHPGTLITMVFSAANTLWFTPNNNIKKAANASAIMTLRFMDTLLQFLSIL